ncbi:MAG: hypothetical protein U1E05_26470, partial [Patescibacteria group bacterium]|nr:hypothetical protein [Patescibacteria group bacterium]
MRLRFLLELCIYAYTAAVLLACALMWWAGDRWWLATILLFGPRWVLALPLVGLIPLAIAFRPRCLWPLGLAAAVMLWPIMGLNVPWRTLADSPEADLRVLTFNIDRWNINEQQLAELLVELKPDLVAIQECPRHRWQVPEPWRVEQAGELLVISAHPILDKAVSYTRHTWRPPYPNGLYCVVDTPAGVVGFACIHLETPRFGLSAVLDRETVLDLEHTDTALTPLEASDVMLDPWTEFPAPSPAAIVQAVP